jgi:hypothetical protein
MASAKVENEIEQWTNDNSHMRGRYPLSYRLQTVDNAKHYDGLWKDCLKRIDEDRYTNLF